MRNSISLVLAFVVVSFVLSGRAFAQQGTERCPAGCGGPFCGPERMGSERPGNFDAAHPRLARAWRFLTDESFRASIEAPMSAADKQTIETAVADLRSALATLKSLRPQLSAAREANDTATIHELWKSARPDLDRIRTDRRTIMDLIAKYKFQNGPANGSQSSGSLLQPVYPNPIHVGGGPATVTYHLSADGPVTILVTDASGTVVEQIANQQERAGDHTVTVGSGITRPGAFYVTVVAGNSKTTQKLAVVE